MTVAPPDAPVVVSAQVDGHGLKMLASGAIAEVRMPDGTVTSAALDQTELPSLLRTATGAAISVDLIPRQPLAAAAVGLPVDVLIKSDPLAAVGRFFSFNVTARGSQK
jgi:hypothetical protein